MTGGRELLEPKLPCACPLPCSLCTRTPAGQRNTRGRKAGNEGGDVRASFLAAPPARHRHGSLVDTFPPTSIRAMSLNDSAIERLDVSAKYSEATIHNGAELLVPRALNASLFVAPACSPLTPLRHCITGARLSFSRSQVSPTWPARCPTAPRPTAQTFVCRRRACSSRSTRCSLAAAARKTAFCARKSIWCAAKLDDRFHPFH